MNSTSCESHERLQRQTRRSVVDVVQAKVQWRTNMRHKSLAVVEEVVEAVLLSKGTDRDEYAEGLLQGKLHLQ